MAVKTADYLIIGGGIVGLTIARRLKQQSPQARIVLLEKEAQVARHSSGRNSGVMHAGFYYPADSLKARFCRDGAKAMRDYCAQHNLPVNKSRKLVVTRDASELPGLQELKRRGDINGVNVELVDEKQAYEIEPHARTFEQALYSPDTVTVDPTAIALHIRAQLEADGVEILTGKPYEKRLGGNAIQAGGERFEAGMIFNCAGLYADRVARDFGFCRDYAILPFKGIYLKHKDPQPPLKVNIYPVPNLANPFLGVHFTITVDGIVKIGPTAIPAFWRQHYGGMANFSARELAEIVRWQAELFATNAFGFRKLAFEEMRKYSKAHLVSLAMGLVRDIDPAGFTKWSTPGIRAQLLDTRNRKLVQDFVVEGDAQSVHVLNAISPAFTCSMPFADWVVGEWVK